MLQLWRPRSPRIRVVLWTVLLASVAVIPLAQAAQTPSPESKFRSGSEVVIEAGETVPHDLYVAGGRIRIDGRIDGDLVVAGGDVELAGPVSGDLWAAGRSITLRSDVGGDARVAGGDVRIEGKVGEDLLVGAGSLTLASAGRVGGDLVLGTGETRLDGTVEGNVLGSTGAYERRGSVGGSERVKVEKRRERAAPTLGDRLLRVVRHYVSVLVVGALLLWLAPLLVGSAVRMLRERPLPSLGAGLLGIAGFAVALLALLLATGVVAVAFGLLTLGGLAAATVVLGALGLFALSAAFLLTVFFVAHALAGIAIGRLALRRQTEPEPSRSADLAALAIGTAVLAVLWAIPVLGGLIKLLTAAGGLGALLLLLMQARRAKAASPPVAATPSG